MKFEEKLPSLSSVSFELTALHQIIGTAGTLCPPVVIGLNEIKMNVNTFQQQTQGSPLTPFSFDFLFAFRATIPHLFLVMSPFVPCHVTKRMYLKLKSNNNNSHQMISSI